MVDDDLTCLTVAKNNLVDRYDIFTIPSGSKLFNILKKVTPDLILLDIEMPEMSGYDVIKVLKNNENTADIPVIFLTAKIDPESEVKGLSLGAVDYITKPFSKELLLKRMELHLLLEAQKKELIKYSHNLEEMVSKKTKTVFELQNAILKTVAELVECRDDVTGGHIERTQKYLILLVKVMLEHGVYSKEISTWDINLFIMSSQLHDVGKISIKDNILMKKGKLTNEEFEEMKKHSVLGADIIQRIEENTTENEFLKYAKLLASSHHEKWDGTGYPKQLKGEDIPLQGRMMSIVDVYDALTSKRQYKKAFTHEESVKIINDGRGTHFDPLLVEVFVKHEIEFKDISSHAFEDIYDISKISTEQLASATKEMFNIIDVHTGMENGRLGRIQRYLKIFINALLKSNSYKKEVSAWDIEIFLMSVQLYDIGKLSVKEEILNKTEKLTEEEYEDIKKHVDSGMKVVQRIREKVTDEKILNHAEALAISHHEKWDGTGYPMGLKGAGIPLQGRIIAIIDVYDALTNERPHREMFSHAEAIEIIKGYSGLYFDPGLVAVFIDNEKEFERGTDCE